MSTEGKCAEPDGSAIGAQARAASLQRVSSETVFVGLSAGVQESHGTRIGSEGRGSMKSTEEAL